MVDQSLVKSGFDIEVLLSARYLQYALLAQVEAGLLPLELDVVDAAAGIDVHITIHPPKDYDRRYDPLPAAVLPDAVDGSFATTLLFDDTDGANLQVSIVTDIRDNTSGSGRTATIGLMLRVSLVGDVDDRGFESNHQLRIELVKLDALTLLGLAFANIPADIVVSQIKAQLDRTVPFGVANGQSVQKAAIQLVPGRDGRPDALGAYINLALKNGTSADAFIGDRGTLSDAENFLDAGKDIAFATSSGLYELLGEDMFFRMAEEDPAGSGNFRHPLREIPGDRSSKELGTLRSINFGPERRNGALTGRLLVDVAGTYAVDFLPDPNFHLLITLEPVIDAEGLLTWKFDASVDVEIFGSVFGLLAIIVGTVLFGLGGGLSIFLLILGADFVADTLASARAADRADELADASFLDALPSRLTLATRRWDPLYTTKHQIVALLKEFTITRAGLAFDGQAKLDKEPAPVAHVVIRDESRDANGAVEGLLYRVRDFGSLTVDLAAQAPGTDRLAFTAVSPATDTRNEANLVSLTLEQVRSRIESKRISAPILCIPQRIYLKNNTIHDLLVLSKREGDEQRSNLIDAFRQRIDARIRSDEGDTITDDETERLRNELGREPTAEEVNAAVSNRIDALVDSAQTDYEAGQLIPDLADAVARVLRFDLAPREFAALQGDGVLGIAGKEIIHMRSGTVYYRDRPDFFFADNLLALRHYRFPYRPPEP